MIECPLVDESFDVFEGGVFGVWDCVEHVRYHQAVPLVELIDGGDDGLLRAGGCEVGVVAVPLVGVGVVGRTFGPTPGIVLSLWFVSCVRFVSRCESGLRV